MALHDPLLSMPPTFDTPSGFPRAHSYNNIPSLANADLARPRTRGLEEAIELPRSASYTSIPTLDTPQCTKELYRVNSVETSPAAKSDNNGRAGVHKQESPSPSKEEPGRQERAGRRKSLVARPKSWIQRRSSTKDSSDGRERSEQSPGTAHDVPPVPSISKSTRDKTKAVSESFATFARKSWKASSRSPSPSRNLAKEKTQDELLGMGNFDMNASTVSTSSPRRLSLIQPKIEKSPTNLAPSPPKLSRTSLTIQKIKQRPQSVLMNFTTLASTNSSTSSLPRSSLDNRSTPRTSTDKVPPIAATEKSQAISLEPPPRRDELWSAFRSIENDYTKFQAKTWSLKTNVVRSQLLPFLKNHASHPSNNNLRSEDLDRRITILNKWWRGLLDVLDGRQNQTVSGVDRPVLLEAAVAIMCRPEWRRGSSAFSPVLERSVNRSPDRSSLKRQKSSNSLASSVASQFLVDSIHHNIRNLYIENLTSQMRFVVDKMSLRHAPASLVTFCGKAAAYAFFFVPGVAEMLVRLWKIEAEGLKRVATELGLPRLNRVGMDEVVAAFPSHIQSLGWSSVRAMSSYLKQPPRIPISATMIPWDGPWVGRWCGRDSDMFFVFVKHYHILAEGFMPSGLSLAAKGRAPGFVLIQAQVLSVLEATIHRQPAAEPPPVTFDEVLAGVDASVATLPSPSNNSTRLMAENRLIMLLRDFISDRPSEYELARMTFAQIFAQLIEATARKTSVFSHSSCYLMCDFLEEALVIYLRFQQAHTHDMEVEYINWPFWLQVCKKMLESNNTMTELRLFSFLYTIWAALISDEQRKESVCIKWLLSEETFSRYFNHWCPMVRAYYMRLLCWRICRDDGESSELDTKIFSTVLLRLKANWGKHIFLMQAAQAANVLPPSTIPCHPAPGRRLLIIRNDNHLPAASLFVGFDGILASPSTASKRNSIPAPSKPQPVSPVPKLTTDTTPIPSSKKRWTFMGKIMPSTFTTTISNEDSPTPQVSSPTKTLEEARRETALARSGPVTRNSSSESDTPTATSTHRAFSFKFSLEWPQNFQKRDAVPQNLSPQANRRRALSNNGRDERRLLPPRLPAPAQAWIGTRVPGISKEPVPRDPAEESDNPESIMQAKYAGRALAEWTHIVGECNNFTERRRDEGVPSLKWVEIPTLGVDGFRKFS